MLNFRIKGTFVPYTRMTRRSKHASDRAKRYLDSQERLAWEFKRQMKEQGAHMIEKTPLRLIVEIERRKLTHTKDSSNLLKALEDAMQKVVFSNDCWIDSISFDRYESDRDLNSIRVEAIE
jgi:Holliday junction resolvase RusA-like endonuclease